jgi:hypothetical protein
MMYVMPIEAWAGMRKRLMSEEKGKGDGRCGRLSTHDASVSTTLEVYPFLYCYRGIET